MVVRVIEAKEDKVTTADLIDELKKSSKIDYSGAIFTFEGIVRGKEENMNLKKLILTTPDKEKTKSEIEKIVDNAKIKYNVHEISVVHYIGEFYTGDMLFLVAVLGAHRAETLDALKEVIETVLKKRKFLKKGLKQSSQEVKMVMNIIRILILFLIIYAVVKGFKTLFKAAIIIFVITILLGLLGI